MAERSITINNNKLILTKILLGLDLIMTVKYGIHGKLSTCTILNTQLNTHEFSVF